MAGEFAHDRSSIARPPPLSDRRCRRPRRRGHHPALAARSRESGRNPIARRRVQSRRRLRRPSASKADNPHWKVIDAHRGYHLFDIRRDGIDARVRVVDTVVAPRATVRTLATLRIKSDKPGARPV
nr:hypothetical protein [Streptomyces brasiliensis]